MSGRSARNDGNRRRRSKPHNAHGGRGNKRGNRGNQKGGKQCIDPKRFINKAEPAQEVAPYQATHTFQDFDFDPRLKSSIEQKGYTDPTPIQDQIIKHVLEGKDVVGIADTGTGKTAAFLLPLINKVIQARSEKVLIITPTRELAQQIENEFISFIKGMRIFSTCCVGGAPIGKQIGRLKRDNNFIIGTPGRLKDLIERDALDLSEFSTLVLDEADRMLDMGFIDDMRHIMSHMPDKRHTLFFSATMSSEISKLINQFLHEPETVSVKSGDTSKQVDQDIVRSGNLDKRDVLENMLAQDEYDKVLVFGETKRSVDQLAKEMNKRGIRSESIHGDKSQSQRERSLKAFKDGKASVLVATDVAARGLDISDVSHVINYDTPQTYDDYVHRVGRTGRAGKTGKAWTFVD